MEHSGFGQPGPNTRKVEGPRHAELTAAAQNAPPHVQQPIEKSPETASTWLKLTPQNEARAFSHALDRKRPFDYSTAVTPIPACRNHSFGNL
jgi:hypothetical protein